MLNLEWRRVRVLLVCCGGVSRSYDLLLWDHGKREGVPCFFFFLLGELLYSSKINERD